MDLADVYRIFHPTSAQYTFFSAAHEILLVGMQARTTTLEKKLETVKI
jgi:hypothetical protein